ncbi:MAG: hypothetical protein IJD49_03725 [Clostridia bacterium]|nr:hypothetical protein [Clostridia bacterium]
MKSREEYEASIYKKRDALLAKRKKNIRMTVTALSVMLCLGAAVLAMPKLMNKAEEAQASSVTKAASGNGIKENKIEETKAVFDEAKTLLADFDVTKAQSNYPAASSENAPAQGAVQNAQDVEYLTMTSEIYRIPETEIALETEFFAENDAAEYPAGSGKNFGYDSTQDTLAPDSIEPATSSKKTYTTEEITAAAESCLSASDAENIISDKTNAVVSRKSDGTTTYTVYFYTAEKKITVKLSDSLKLIEITEKDNAGGTTQIAPAYNPDEE